MSNYSCPKCGQLTYRPSLCSACYQRERNQQTELVELRRKEIRLQEEAHQSSGGNNSYTTPAFFQWVGFSIVFLFASLLWWNGKWIGFPLFKLQFIIGELTIAIICYFLKGLLGVLVEFVYGLVLIAICLILGGLLLGYLLKDETDTSPNDIPPKVQAPIPKDDKSARETSSPKIPKAEIVQKHNQEASLQLKENSKSSETKPVDSRDTSQAYSAMTPEPKISFEDADKELNAVYKRAMAQLNAEAQANLKASQRKWIKEKERKDPETQIKLTLERIEEIKSVLKK
jgi:uncharacterized protein YecT (DUF1311 family)